MRSTGVLASMCAGFVVCLAAVHGAAGNGLLRVPTAASLAHCPTSCGGVKISYPFGIGAGCFRRGFELTCDPTARPPRLLLGNSNIQLTYISVDNRTAGTSTIGYNIIMSPDTDTYTRSWKTPAEGVMISDYNSLYVVGCNVEVYMFGDNMTDLVGSCMSICTETTERAGNVGSYCGGIGCCYINYGLRELPAFMINLVRHNSTRAEQDKALSEVKIFLLDYYRFNVTDLFSSWVNTSNAYSDTSSIFSFAITDQPNCKRAQLNKDSYACNDESNCHDLPSARGYYCFCPNSQGNPYVVYGCIQDYNSTHRENCTRSCGNMPIPFPFGIEEGCYAGDNFRLSCTPRDVTVLDRGYAQYHVTNLSLDDGFLAVSNRLSDTSSNNMERIIYSNYNGAYGTFEGHFKSVVDGIFYFSEEDEVINWVVANLTCQQAVKRNDTRRNDTYACVSQNSHCQNVTRGKTRYGYLCKCNDGFQGNPYLRNNCTDIDECNIPIKCNGICHNYDGGFNCTSCSHGKVYDPTKRKCVISANKERNLISGISIGLVALVLSMSCAYMIHQKRSLAAVKQRYFRQHGGLLLFEEMKSKQGLSFTLFTKDELEEATDKFDERHVLGKGGNGTVYKGALKDKRLVAIKKCKLINERQEKEFGKEMLILSQVNHRNIVRLYGCCLEVEVPMLVYQFIPNGTLYQLIHGRPHETRISFTTRLKIAHQTAEALAYLHSWASPPIIHGDVKSPNILIDEDYTAKVADFGASTLAPTDEAQFVTFVQGTYGYLDPEYMQTSKLTSKSDVYSFGVVLLELLTSRKAMNLQALEEEKNLSSHFLLAVSENRLGEILDEQIKGEQSVELIEQVAELAKECLEMASDRRPSMREVAEELERVRKLLQHPWSQQTSDEERKALLVGSPITRPEIELSNGYVSLTDSAYLGVQSPR